MESRPPAHPSPYPHPASMRPEPHPPHPPQPPQHPPPALTSSWSSSSYTPRASQLDVIAPSPSQHADRRYPSDPSQPRDLPPHSAPPEHSLKHQRHASYTDAPPQRWPPSSVSQLNGPAPPIPNSYDKRRNSYGSSMSYPPPNLRGPHDGDSQSPLRPSPRDVHDMPHQAPTPTRAHGHTGSLGGSPPHFYRGAPESSTISPAHSYTARQMPPPSSPKQYAPGATYPTPPPRGPVPAPSPSTTFSTGRDLPSISSAGRPGSSMSISSMLGADSQAPTRDSAPPPPRNFHPSTVSSSSPPSYAAIRPASPSASPAAYSPYRRPRTPDRYPRGPPHDVREHQANTAGSPSAAGHVTSAPPSQHYPMARAPIVPQSDSPTDRPGPSFYSSHGSIPPRPSSQPLRHGAPSRYAADESRFAVSSMPVPPASGEGARYQAALAESRDWSHGDRGLRGPSDPYHRNPVAGHDSGHHPSQHEHRRNGPGSSPVRPVSDGPPMEYVRHSDPPSHPRPWEAGEQQSHHPGTSTATDPSGRRMSEGTYLPNGRHEYGEYPPADAPQIRPEISPPYPTGGDASTNSHPPHVGPTPMHHVEDGLRPMSRNQLGVGADLGRRSGRISPLPQAVQGAQGQLSGPGEEPGIKSEFGRMFSGIGSGVGSAMATPGSVANGRHTPTLGPSPTKREDSGDTGMSVPMDGEELQIARTGSRVGRRGKRAKYDEGKGETDNGDGRATPGTINGNGVRKARHPHHHHHHPHPHPHPHQYVPLARDAPDHMLTAASASHHHHHSPTSPTHAPLRALPPSVDPVFRSITPGQSGSVVSNPAAHHHHHHHHHHHATTTGRVTPSATPAAPVPPPRIATTTVLSQGVLDSVAHLPRHHLGSTLYSPTLSVLPPSRHSKFGFESTPRPFPYFEGQENCTFTVRVPRYHLLSDSREEIVRRRALWGTGIYTDDSDVVAAAIHGGWIRGAWADDVDLSLLNLGSTHDATDLPSDTLLAPPPTGPISPPTDKDLHITLVVLPALQRYASTVSRGLRSRAWGDNHDGLSYKIEKMAWVAESTDVPYSRGAEARRKRLRGVRDERKDMVDGGTRLRSERGGKSLGQSTWAVKVVA
ncbi:MAG: hypothetical protein M1838_000758 [Thelocarpon superellum]|nr:MAG: hypothetical protein M1838_000758 [Thelocarpon superellum]